MALTSFFKGTGATAIANPPPVVNVAHNLTAIPTLFWAIPRTVDHAAAALNTYEVTADATNVIITAAGNWAAIVTFDVLAIVAAHVADEAAALLNTAHVTAMVKSATETCIVRSVPAAKTPTREGSFATVSIAGAGTDVRTLVQLQALFTLMDFANEIIEFQSDNPLVVVALTGGAIANGITCTNLDPNNSQQAVIRVREIHSLVA